MINKFKFYLIFLKLILILVNCQNSLNDYGFGIVDESSICTSYIGDELCKNRLSNSESIYTTPGGGGGGGIDKLSQISTLPILQKGFQSLTFSQGICKDLNFIEFGMCDSALSPCIETTPKITPGYNISLPQRVCKSVCERMLIGCPQLAIQIDCSISFLFPKIGTFYNLTKYGYTANGGMYMVPCIDTEINYEKNKVQENVGFLESCPYPLLLKNSTDPQYAEKRGYTYLTPTNCVLPCPIPNYTKRQMDSVINMSKAMSSISFVLSLFNVITFGLLIKKKSKYNVCIALMAIGSSFIYLSDIINYGVGIEKQLCPEPGRVATQRVDSLCGFTGSIFHIGITLCVLWSMTMGIVLYSKIKQFKLPNFRYFLIGNLSFTVVTLIILASAKKFQGGNGFLECWMRDRWYVVAIFWIPCGIALLLGVLSICGVIFEIYKISKNVSLKDSKVVIRELKPFVLVVTVSASLIYLFVFYFDSESKYDFYKKGVEDYILCLLTSENPLDECYTVGPNFNSYFMFYFLIRFFGILFFGIFGTSEIARNAWTESFFVTKIKSKISITTVSSSTRGGGGDTSGIKSSSSSSNSGVCNNNNSTRKNYGDDFNSKNLSQPDNTIITNNNNNDNNNKMEIELDSIDI
ncbi:G-protein-coupled receptor family protein [Dictyostelium discoideum AX4]|uniref:Frizzled and smoothened-like protein D n=1 Tax=Dictyostelium discoideum TaxID=44689 RepID=FSLD_DICDI|nr:G-protein-coupled receptor family protein [Dictyostelium discoideum AX4]Q55DT7.1 RecName: Full=Frizzled and smoothened-like protein D; Flags: Precursor [Dictyostelium discoideum]EAL72114.1 G-protein-coupled receptor family protein [Dictyostelium discoideum AX4]|eukprot:XP_646044.1 G-protein-coupled receptor family protein [Dictyostelium discoideum AX4]